MGITEWHTRFEGEEKEGEGKCWNKANKLLFPFDCGK